MSKTRYNWVLFAISAGRTSIIRLNFNTIGKFEDDIKAILCKMNICMCACITFMDFFLDSKRINTLYSFFSLSFFSLRNANSIFMHPFLFYLLKTFV